MQSIQAERRTNNILENSYRVKEMFSLVHLLLLESNLHSGLPQVIISSRGSEVRKKNKCIVITSESPKLDLA